VFIEGSNTTEIWFNRNWDKYSDWVCSSNEFYCYRGLCYNSNGTNGE